MTLIKLINKPLPNRPELRSRGIESIAVLVFKGSRRTLRKSLSLAIASTAVLAVLAGCAKEESKQSSPSPAVSAIAEKLSFEAPAQGATLTKEQAREIKSVFANKSVMVLPPGELIFPDKKTTREERALKESKLMQADANSYELLKAIQNGCSKVRPTTKIDATFPTDGEASYDNVRVGDQASGSTTVGLAGPNCPVEVSMGASMGAKVEAVDAKEKTATASGSMSIAGKGLMLAPKYTKLLGARGLIVDSQLSAVGATHDQQGNLQLNYKLAGSYLTLDSTIPYEMSVQMLTRSTSEESTMTEMVVKTKIHMSNFTADLQAHITGTKEAKDQKLKLYVNGRETTQQEFEELFGRENPAVNGQSQVIEALR